MFVKRYLVNDMQEAMAKIRTELGNDAVILNSRFVRQKGMNNFFKKKKLEVVAAYDSKIKKRKFSMDEEQAQVKIPAQVNATVQQKPSDENEQMEKLNDKFEELQKVVLALADKMNVAEKPEQQQPQYSREVSRFYEKMIEQGVETALADSMAKDVDKVTSKMEVEPTQVMTQLISEKLGEVSTIKIKKYKRNVIILLGPTGVGKTTTLVKLAGHFVCDDNLKVGIINTDTYRVAAKEQLKIYSEIMEIPMETAYTSEELKAAMKKLDDRDLILMDTAGRSCADEQFRDDIENIINTCEPDEVFVTLSLTTGYNASKKIIDELSFIEDYKIILTKFDEVETWGNILNIAEYAKKPLSYITVGQSIPDDIEHANIAKIASNILMIGDSI